MTGGKIVVLAGMVKNQYTFVLSTIVLALPPEAPNLQHANDEVLLVHAETDSQREHEPDSFLAVA